jgi:hypothetical protein
VKAQRQQQHAGAAPSTLKLAHLAPISGSPRDVCSRDQNETNFLSTSSPPFFCPLVAEAMFT